MSIQTEIASLLESDGKKYRIILKSLYDVGRNSGNDDDTLPREKRVVEADYITYINDHTLLAGIDPGTYERATTSPRSGGGRGTKKFSELSELYSVKWVPAPNKLSDSRGFYLVTKKFRHILSMNVDNIESINGKPLLSIGNVEGGLRHLGPHLDVTSESKEQPKKYRIVMRRGTVVEADHVAALDDAILLVGIGTNGHTRITKISRPRPHPDFYIHGHTPIGVKPADPHHTYYKTDVKFDKVLTMHVKNIESINGKPVFDISDVSRGAETMHKYLDVDESWTIDNISKLIE